MTDPSPEALPGAGRDGGGGRDVPYFAYGSNLDPAQMRRRCPGHRFRCVARLEGRRLAFTRYSAARRCGVADVVRAAAGEVVWGVVYDLTADDLAELDRCEQFVPGRVAGNGYERVATSVIPLMPDGTDGPPMAAQVYLACAGPDAPLPSRAYLRHILDGARHWRLPAGYVSRLERIETMPE